MTFFVDRDLGPRVGEALRSVQVDVVLHRERFGPTVPDTEWITAVTSDGLVILSRDRKMRTRPAERAAFERVGARCFVVATAASSPLEDLRALLWAWPIVVGHVAGTPGPFMFGVSREGRLTQWIPVGGPRGPAARARRLRASRKRAGP